MKGANEEGRFWESACRETTEEAVILGISMQGDKGRETNEEGRFWESACRATNEGRQMKKGD